MKLVHEYIQSRHWAILDEYLTLMCAVAERDLEASEDTMRLIQKRLGTPVHGTREVTVRDGVAVVPVAGPMFRYANLFTQISGAVSYERLAADIGQVMADPKVESVVYDVNSPGGEVDGAGELADLIASFRGTKPQTAYISHLGASAGYWIAAAADRVVISDTGMAGSIGSVITTRKRVREGVEEMIFVTSFAPDKRLDPFSKDSEEAARAHAKLQDVVDKVGTVFAESVAEYRGMTLEEVMETRGGLFVGSDAVDVGLADGAGTLEQIMAALSSGSNSGPAGHVSLTGLDTPTGDVQMQTETSEKEPQAPVIDRAFLAAEHSDLVESIMAEAASAERKRILGIYDLDAHGFDDLKREKMADPTATAGTAAQAILSAKGEQEQRRKQAVKDSLAADEEDLEAVGSASLPNEEPSTEDQLAASILKWVPAAQQEIAAEA